MATNPRLRQLFTTPRSPSLQSTHSPAQPSPSLLGQGHQQTPNPSAMCIQQPYQHPSGSGHSSGQPFRPCPGAQQPQGSHGNLPGSASTSYRQPPPSSQGPQARPTSGSYQPPYGSPMPGYPGSSGSFRPNLQPQGPGSGGASYRPASNLGQDRHSGHSFPSSAGPSRPAGASGQGPPARAPTQGGAAVQQGPWVGGQNMACQEGASHGPSGLHSEPHSRPHSGPHLGLSEGSRGGHPAQGSGRGGYAPQDAAAVSHEPSAQWAQPSAGGFARAGEGQQQQQAPMQQQHAPLQQRPPFNEQQVVALPRACSSYTTSAEIMLGPDRTIDVKFGFDQRLVDALKR